MALVRMTELLQQADKNNVGCGAFNVGNMEMVRGVIKAAEELKTPIIMQIAEGRLKSSPLDLMGPMMIRAAEKSSVDVAVHLDHGKTMGIIKSALEMGFTSVMYDGSDLSLDANIEKTCEVVEEAAKYGAAVEGELGHVGGNEGEGKKRTIQYTNSDDVVEFCGRTGVDALAVSIGNAHGAYDDAPMLAFGVLQEIRRKTKTPLVLHGGSGISDADFQKAIGYGIRKINIATSNFRGLVRHAEMYLEYAIAPDYFSLSEVMTDGVYENVKKHIRVFNEKRRRQQDDGVDGVS